VNIFEKAGELWGQFLTAIGVGGDIASQAVSTQTVLDSLAHGARLGTYQPHGPGMYTDVSELPMALRSGTPAQQEQARGSFNEAVEYDPRIVGWNFAQPYVENAYNRSTTGRMQELPGEVHSLYEDVNSYFADVRENPDIWTDKEMEAAASKAADQMTGGTLANLADIDSRAARMHLSPAAHEAMRSALIRAGSDQYAAARRGFTEQNRLYSKQRADQAGALQGQIGQSLLGLEGNMQITADDLYNAAQTMMASNIMAPYEMMQQTSWLDMMAKAGALADTAQMFGGIGELGGNIWGGQMQSHAASGSAGSDTSWILPAAGTVAQTAIKIIGGCIDGEAPVTTSRGPVALKDVQIGDAVLTPAGYRKVLGRDLGKPHPENNVWITISTEHGDLRLTTTHHIAGKPADTIRPGDVLEIQGGEARVTAVNCAEPPELAGDLQVEGCNAYCVGGIYVNSMAEYAR
jgi:hypothetical protein